MSEILPSNPIRRIIPGNAMVKGSPGSAPNQRPDSNKEENNLSTITLQPEPINFEEKVGDNLLIVALQPKLIDFEIALWNSLIESYLADVKPWLEKNIDRLRNLTQ